MDPNSLRLLCIRHRHKLLKITIYLSIVCFMSNLNALIDVIIHPAIPYFDRGHLIVGGVTGFTTLIVFGLIAFYACQLEKALREIKTLETFLNICAGCKKVLKPGADPRKPESWQSIDSYITQNTDTEFSHGTCPDCAKALFPELKKALAKKNPDLEHPQTLSKEFKPSRI